jgi:Transposase DDE domain
VLARGAVLHGSADGVVGAERRGGVGGCPFPRSLGATLPFKLNQAGRHRIPRQKHKVTNWPAYDASLRQRGSLTVWFTDEAITAWKAEPRTTRGGQPWYSPLAILTALTLRAVFRLALRQTEGLIGSIIGLLGLDLPVPDHTTLSRRAATLEVPRPQSSFGGAGGEEEKPPPPPVERPSLKLCGPGEWLVEKHGTKMRRSWRKLHLGMDAGTGQIVTSVMTGHDVDDGSQVGPLLDQVTGAVASFTGDGAYDQESVYASVSEHHPAAAIIVPPRATAVPSRTAESEPTQRDPHLQLIAERGRRAWQRASGYTKRALAETAIGRWKQVIGDGLRSHTDERRATEVDVAVHVLNRMLELGRPTYVRIA